MSETCLLCGFADASVRVGLVAWRQPVAGRRFEAVPRCEDRAACQSRLEAQGETWPLARHGNDNEEIPSARTAR